MSIATKYACGENFEVFFWEDRPRIGERFDWEGRGTDPTRLPTGVYRVKDVTLVARRMGQRHYEVLLEPAVP